ncbi:PAS-domain containing protein [Sulfitobacter sp. D35]|uniref:PAS-domain containing protein n=1 Tax=Sulfitobacter sp. D35 TaxID=3083252 RepID=UPI00296FE484|nr:PAS-domain containing protein [Sulfitobacter sp. D35]MDW4500094.1 PAS-domain containing protein [Sulfitobacter sp. D35]
MPHSPLQIRTLTTAGLNLIAQALSIYDSDLKLAVCNAPFQHMFDLPDHLVTPGATFEDTIRHLVTAGEYGPVADIEAFVTERVEQALAFVPHYMERTRANGRTISVEGSPLPQRGWVTVYTDITRSKQQEALLRARSEELSDQLVAYSEELSSTNRELAAMNTALAEAKRELTEIEARTRLTTEMMPAHIAHVDDGGHYTYSNRRLSTMFPGRDTEILGRHIGEVLGPRAFERIAPKLQQAYDGTASVFEFGDEASARRIRAAFTPDGRGGVYILSMDVTEETQARAALQQTRRRALAAQMTSGLAHDFSNLLTIILGLQSNLKRLDGLPAEAPALIEATLAAARRGGGLLESIADVTARRTLRPGATDLHALLEDLRTLAAPTLPTEIRLNVICDAPDRPMLLDAGMVQDSLLNLILNARDACGTHGTITIRCRALHETWIEWVVSDTGPGFSPRALERAFDPFFTTKGAEGTGMGLPMVWDMTKLAGGDLRLSNTEDGAQVVLRLPYRPAVAAPTGLVLLVEDREDLREIYRDMLTGLGHSVVEAVSADEATALLADVPDISLILSDIQLEGEATGIDLAARVAGSNTAIVLMTSLPADDALSVQARARAPVLQKPFTAEDLAALTGVLTEAAQ